MLYRREDWSYPASIESMRVSLSMHQQGYMSPKIPQAVVTRDQRLVHPLRFYLGSGAAGTR